MKQRKEQGSKENTPKIEVVVVVAVVAFFRYGCCFLKLFLNGIFGNWEFLGSGIYKISIFI
jgi:hypothetical protein